MTIYWNADTVKIIVLYRTRGSDVRHELLLETLRQVSTIATLSIGQHSKLGAFLGLLLSLKLAWL